MPGFGRRDLLVKVQGDELEDFLDFREKRMQRRTGRRRLHHRQFRFTGSPLKGRQHACDYIEFIKPQLNFRGEISRHGPVLRYRADTAPTRNRRPDQRGPRAAR